MRQPYRLGSFPPPLPAALWVPRLQVHRDSVWRLQIGPEVRLVYLKGKILCLCLWPLNSPLPRTPEEPQPVEADRETEARAWPGLLGSHAGSGEDPVAGRILLQPIQPLCGAARPPTGGHMAT